MHRDIEACRSFIDAATIGLDDERAAIRVDGRWSIAEIIEHLDRTYTGTVKGLERCLDAGTPRVSATSARTRLRRFFVVTLGWFPTGIQAPRHVLPAGEMPLSALTGRIRSHLADMDAVLVRTTERFGAGPVLDHPILGPFTADDWTRFHRVHTRHHCRQIDERRRRVDGLG
jgi:hypothetical protein